VETTRRAVAKAASWQALGLVVMTAITYPITGSVAEGGLVAILGAATGMLTYVLHEKAWANIAWGIRFDRHCEAAKRAPGSDFDHFRANSEFPN
jgi:uncharacterized membrane protein